MSWHDDAQAFIKIWQFSWQRNSPAGTWRDRISFLISVCSIGLLSGCTNVLQPLNTPSPTETVSPAVSPSPVPVSPTATLTPSPTVSLSPTTSPSGVSGKPDAVSAIETKLSELVSKEVGVTVQSVNCPAGIEQKPGKTYECQVLSNIEPFTVVVEPTGIGEQFRWGTKGLLLLAKLDEFIQKSAQSQGLGRVTVDCGSKVRPAKAGDTFECKVTDAKGRLRSTKVTVRDELGNVYISPL